LDAGSAAAAGQLAIEGDPADVARLVAAVGDADPDFPIVTPRAPLGG
jgi:hypothetical protein